MRPYLYFLLVLFGLFRPSTIGDEDDKVLPDIIVDFEKASSGQDRCCNTGCIARVTPGKREQVAKVKKESYAAAVYFEEDAVALKDNERLKIHEFMSSTKANADITVIGYADGCGSMSYNRTLSMQRAQRVKQEILKLKPSSLVKVRAAGEISAGHSAKSRKVHIALTRNVLLYDPPPAIISDVYLVDGSSSMAGSKFEKYRRAITYHRPPNSRVYLSTTACVRTGKSYNTIMPSGGTEIWYAYWYILDKMYSGQTLTIISDFDSTYPLTSREEAIIRNKARSRGIIVKLISI